MAEGSETPGEESGGVPEGRGRGPDGDLLAERRARRAAESGETALVRRAEAAEATVHTLETHVATLQERLRDAEDERRRISELIAAEQTSVSGQMSSTEQELRRAKQREYAEQRLRVEAEDRCMDVERESRIEIDLLSRRLNASEQGARELAGELESVQRKLAEAEQAAATEIAAVRRSEQSFQARLTELERRALEIQRGLEAERAARERAERLLEEMREANQRVERIVGEMGGAVARLRAAAATAPAGEDRHESVSDTVAEQDLAQAHPVVADAARALRSGPAEAQRDEMTDALAAAVERLRARVEDVGADLADAPEGEADASREPRAGPALMPAAQAPRRPRHKHSMSAIGRWRIRRKDRRRRRSAAAEPPSIQSQ